MSPIGSRMTVGVLRELLSHYDKADGIVVASDEEGNSFGYPTIRDGFEERLAPELGEGRRALVLYPIIRVEEET